MGIDSRGLRGFALGLGAGALIAGVIYVTDHRHQESAPATTSPQAAHSAVAGAASRGHEAAPTAAAASSSESQYDFYRMLPNFEVVVPEKEHGTKIAPAAQVDRPGTYFLQVGSYREIEVAQRISAQLSRLGIESSVQRVAVDTDVWHRVRIGPIKDLAKLNHLRQQLRASDLDSLVVRVED